ncbi:hypothetical protein [Phenylobacterium sp.]|uniref:head-tail connector protein n=1 Tax=Phenylobacterium sp. TaxID=1871053 RepID=UPI0019A2A3F1|nr:hypothetical protein [Phenylobacterium sp.]MBC7168318.1 hypothetical protein [Phenylobacterium sp.]
MDLQLQSTPLTREEKLEVVPIAEVKRDLRVFHADDDASIGDDIEAAYDYLAGPNGWLGRCSLLEETWEAFLPGGLGASFELPMRPFAGDALVSLSYLSDGAYLDLDAARYTIRRNLETFAIIGHVHGQPWPYVAATEPAAFRVRFKAGFGATKDAIPSTLRKAIRLLAGHYYKAREATSDEGQAPGREIAFGLKALAGRFRISPDHS